MNHFVYHKPQSLVDVFRLKQENPEASFIAGGTDLMVRMKNRELSPPALISLRSVAQLGGIQTGSDQEPVRIGAATTITEILEHNDLVSRFPVLAMAARRLGSRQIRNVATIGGNLCNCSPCADTATPLLVYEARVCLSGPGETREIPLEEFLVGPGQTCSMPDEILTSVVLDPPSNKSKGTFKKKGRVKMDLAIASVAMLLELDKGICIRARLAAGSVAPVCTRLRDTESLLQEKPLTPELADQAADLSAKAVSPISDIRATAGYRRRIVGIYVRRSIDEIMGWGGRS
jgi:aerobic carbon-monoxide dehydrogenase medium subunit